MITPSPRPWRAVFRARRVASVGRREDEWLVLDANNETVCRMVGREKADAEAIVKAVNQIEAAQRLLVEAVEGWAEAEGRKP